MASEWSQEPESPLLWVLVPGGRGGGSLSSKPVHQLLALLLGQGELNRLASWLNKASYTFVNALAVILNSRDSDALLLTEVLAADPWQGDGLVDTRLDRFRVGDLNLRLHNSNNRDIDASLLSNLLTVVLTISMRPMSISILGRLTDSDHLGVTLLVKSNLDSLGCGGFCFWPVRVGADLIVNGLSAFRADSPGDSVALLSVHNPLDGEGDRAAGGLKGGSADLSQFHSIFYSAVVLGVFISAIAMLGVAIG